MNKYDFIKWIVGAVATTALIFYLALTGRFDPVVDFTVELFKSKVKEKVESIDVHKK